MEAIRHNLYMEEVVFKEYTLTFLYDKNYNFFSILIDWEFRDDITKEILNHLCPDEVEVYIWGFDEDVNQELNLKLLDLVFNEI